MQSRFSSWHFNFFFFCRCTDVILGNNKSFHVRLPFKSYRWLFHTLICLRYKLLFEICAKLRKNKAVFSHRIFYGCIRNKKVFARLGKILHDLERGVFRDVSWFFTFCSYAVFYIEVIKRGKKEKKLCANGKYHLSTL